jgi:putative transposase
MREMGLTAIYPKKNISKADNEHQKHPYLLKGLEVVRPNQVWGTDITYIKANRTWFYLVAVLDWFSRFVVAWRLSPNLTADFCADNLNNALGLAQPEIHNSDQGCQFTSEEYVGVLKKFPDIKISMDGRGRCFDNIFTERLWRTVKYEEVYLHDYQSCQEAETQLKLFFEKYNYRRLHQSLNYQTPAEIYFNQPFQPPQKPKVDTI